MEKTIKCIEENNFEILECDSDLLKKKYRNEIYQIITDYKTDTEKESVLYDLAGKIKEIRDRNYIGIYFDINPENSKELKSFIEELQLYLKVDPPREFRYMNEYDYDPYPWVLYLENILKGIKIFGEPSLIEKLIKKFYDLNRRSYNCYKAQLKLKIINEYIELLPQGEDNTLFIEAWESDRNNERIKLLETYNTYCHKRKLGKIVAIQKIFDDLKSKLMLIGFTDSESSEEIKKITGITFYKEGVGLNYDGVARTITGYKKYIND